MKKAKFELTFLKKTAKINGKILKDFVVDVLKEFGGLNLLSNVTIGNLEENSIEISVTDDFASMACTAFTMCGSYKDLKCCFKEVECI